MKYFREKFQRKINFVKPLYRRVRPKVLPKINDFVTINANFRKQGGRDACVKETNIDNGNFSCDKKCRLDKSKCCCERNIKRRTLKYDGEASRNSLGFQRNRFDGWIGNGAMLGLANASGYDENRRNRAYRGQQTELQLEADKNVIHRVPDSWLRVYPAPILPGESICSVIFRFILCQIGLTIILVIWTIGMVTVINHFEGPYEIMVTLDFQDRQHQLVIDLATQLRQMTPISPKWRQIIEDRIEEERQLTIEAVGNGARLRPGHFWDICGTFLFTVYVMTALGFGAPVPQTIGGRTATLIYAAFAVPTHIYLMVNASTCIVIHVEDCTDRMVTSLNETGVLKKRIILSDHTSNKGNPNHSRLLSQNQDSKCRRNMRMLLGYLCMGRCMPLSIFMYYVFGVLIFGLARNKLPLEMVMFPLEFTTTGGLERVECHIRILYGLYVEGAMMLLACALDTMRRHSGSAVSNMAQRYRLFDSEPCRDCDIGEHH